VNDELDDMTAEWNVRLVAQLKEIIALHEPYENNARGFPMWLCSRCSRPYPCMTVEAAERGLAAAPQKSDGGEL
jgi:hypothetical protein